MTFHLFVINCTIFVISMWRFDTAIWNKQKIECVCERENLRKQMKEKKWNEMKWDWANAVLVLGSIDADMYCTFQCSVLCSEEYQCSKAFGCNSAYTSHRCIILNGMFSIRGIEWRNNTKTQYWIFISKRRENIRTIFFGRLGKLWTNRTEHIVVCLLEIVCISKALLLTDFNILSNIVLHYYFSFHMSSQYSQCTRQIHTHTCISKCKLCRCRCRCLDANVFIFYF